MSIGKSLQNAVVAFALAVVAGVCIPVLKMCVTGSSDPFQAGWPLFLHGSACVAAFAISWKWLAGLTSAAGVYAGLVGYLLAFENPEYLAASLIALAIHGFIPALFGSLVALAIRFRSVRVPESRTNA